MLKLPSTLKLLLFHSLELVITLCIILPSVLGYWRGVWTLLGIYVLPSLPEVSAWISVFIGLGLINIFGLIQNLHNKWFPFKTVRWHVYSRLYSFVLAFAVVNHWRGVWAILDYYTSTSLTSSLVFLAIGSVCLILLRGVKNIAPQPSVVFRDHEPDVFDCTTRFEVSSSDWSVKHLFELDLVLSYFIIHSLVVFFWRGIWQTLDTALLPEDKALSTYISLALGYGIFIVCYALQTPARKASRYLARKAFLLHLLFEDTYYFIVGFSSVNAWRALWNICDYLILPEDLVLSCIITTVVGTIIAYVMLAGRSIGAVGCAVDGRPKDGTGVLFLHYLNKLNQEPVEAEAELEARQHAHVQIDGEVIYDPEDFVTTRDVGVGNDDREDENENVPNGVITN